MRQGGDLHRIIVVGGGAGGLELVTHLGDKFGRRNLAKVTLIDVTRPSVEAAAARDRRRNHGSSRA